MTAGIHRAQARDQFRRYCAAAPGFFRTELLSPEPTIDDSAKRTTRPSLRTP